MGKIIQNKNEIENRWESNLGEWEINPSFLKMWLYGSVN